MRIARETKGFTRKSTSGFTYGPAGGGPNPNANLAEGIVSYWYMDTLDKTANTYVDQVGTNDIDETSSISSSTGVRGDVNSSASFFNNYANCGGFSLGLDSNTSFTIQAWVDLSTNPAGARALVAKQPLISSALTDCDYYLWQDVAVDGFLKFSVKNGLTTYTVSLGTGTAAAWNHVVCGWDKENSQIFIQNNGGTRVTTPLVANMNNAGTIFNIGGLNGLPSGAHRIDMTAFWERALSEEETIQLYNGGWGVLYKEML